MPQPSTAQDTTTIGRRMRLYRWWFDDRMDRAAEFRSRSGLTSLFDIASSYHTMIQLYD